jgi:pyruvate formate lyase activating enzyme
MGLLDGITLSGGECLLCPEIGAICKALKRMGFRVKLDSNGCRPEVLRKLLEDEVIDYVALDYKAPRGSFEAVTGREAFGAFSESLDMLIGSGVDFETRTTVHSHLLDEQDVDAIISDLESRGYRKNYYVQNFVDHGPSIRTLSPLPAHRPLDRDRIRGSELFEIRFRNFD